MNDNTNPPPGLRYLRDPGEHAVHLITLLAISSENISSLEAEIPTLNAKSLRWLARIHSDNRVRRLLLERSGVSIGQGTVINYGFVVSDDYKPLLTLGKRVAIGPNVQAICVSNPNNSRLCDLTHDAIDLCMEGRIFVGDDAWIGAGSVILPGVQIGVGAVVGANSVVSRDVAAFEVVAGAPLRHHRFLRRKLG